MPSTIDDVFAGASLRPSEAVRWRERVPSRAPGVYVVALSAQTSAVEALSACPIDGEEIERLLSARPELRVDGRHPSAPELAARLASFWLADESVLYVGLAGRSLQNRVGQYYRTPLGDRRPHAGGWWLKTLSTCDRLWVYWAPTEEYRASEKAMLQTFAAGVSSEASKVIRDPERVAPFANLRDHNDLIKRHRIRRATGDPPPGRNF